MNKREEKIDFKSWLQLDGRLKRSLLIGGLALILMVAAWWVFRQDKTVDAATIDATETEKKVMRLLSEIEGVGEANVIVCEEENSVQSVVVVCEGARDLRVVMNVREAVATALGTEEKMVKIYLKKE